MKVLWLKDSKAGHLNKARGLLRALAERIDLQIVEHEVGWRWPWMRQLLSRMGTVGLKLPAGWFVRKLPDLRGVELILSAGGATQWPNAAIALQTGKKNVFLGSPRKMAATGFSLIALHDPPNERPPYFRFELIPSLVTPAAAAKAAADARLSENNSWGLLIGGDGEGVVWTPEDYILLAERFLSQAREADVSVWVATSRRTPQAVEAGVRSLAEDSGRLEGSCWYHQRSDDAVPLLAMLGVCRRLCVTADSMSMTHEAISSGRPVIAVTPGTCGNRRLLDNLALLEKSGYLVNQRVSSLAISTAEPSGGWNHVSADPTGALADAVIELPAAWMLEKRNNNL